MRTSPGTTRRRTVPSCVRTRGSAFTTTSTSSTRSTAFASNRRYLEFVSAMDDPTVGTKNLDKVTQSKSEAGRNYKGFNFFSTQDRSILLALLRGEHTVTGLRHADLQRPLPQLSSGQISRNLKRLRVHGLIKRVGCRYKYYVTQLGQRAILTGLKLRELLIPQLTSPPPAAPLLPG